MNRIKIREDPVNRGLKIAELDLPVTCSWRRCGNSLSEGEEAYYGEWGLYCNRFCFINDVFNGNNTLSANIPMYQIILKQRSPSIYRRILSHLKGSPSLERLPYL